MTINDLIHKIKNFEYYVVGSGFHRDIQEYSKFVAQSQKEENIVYLKEVISNVLKHLEHIMSSDLPDELEILLPGKNTSFTNTDYIGQLKELMESPDLSSQDIASKLSNILKSLLKNIDQNKQAIEKLKNVLLPYAEEYERHLLEEKQSAISFIFKDLETIQTLKAFSTALTKWNKALFIYYQLVTSDPPEDVSLVAIKPGSLDVIINLNIDVAINFSEIVKYGLMLFGGYLAYKNQIKDIVATYFGNEDLIKDEKERERKLLKNIDKTIKNKLLEQHECCKVDDPQINEESIEQKIKTVGDTLAEHIVKGNDIKLLIIKGEEGDDESGASKKEKISKEIESESLKIRKSLKQLNSEDRKALEEHYTQTEKD